MAKAVNITRETQPTIMIVVPSQGISVIAATKMPATVNTKITIIIVTVLLTKLAASTVPAFSHILKLSIH